MINDRITLEDVPYEVQQLRQDVAEIRNYLRNQAATTSEPIRTVSDKELLTVKDVSQMLNLSKGAIYNMTSAQRIPFFKNGGRVYFDRKAINEWVRNDRRKTIKQLQEEAEKEHRK